MNTIASTFPMAKGLPLLHQNKKIVPSQTHSRMAYPYAAHHHFVNTYNLNNMHHKIAPDRSKINLRSIILVAKLAGPIPSSSKSDQSISKHSHCTQCGKTLLVCIFRSCLQGIKALIMQMRRRGQYIPHHLTVRRSLASSYCD